MEDIQNSNDKNKNIYLYLTKFINIINDTKININESKNNLQNELETLNNRFNENVILFKTIIQNNSL